MSPLGGLPGVRGLTDRGAFPPSAAQLGAAPATTKILRPDEDAFVTLAADEPSSAGFVIENNELVLLVTNQARSTAASQALSRRLRNGEFGLPQFALRGASGTRIVEFTFRELSDWRDSAFVNVLKIAGVAYDDLDEARNRVTIGVYRDAPPNVKAVVTSTLAKLGVPVSALNFVNAEHGNFSTLPRSLSAEAGFVADPGADLQSGSSIIGGGYQIVRGGTTSACTLTTAATWNGSPVYMTASHCSQYVFDTD